MRNDRHRQERWLHTRISEELEGALKREARRQRRPVSLLVRNVLEGALDLVEDIVGDSLDIAQRSRRLAEQMGGAARHERPALTGVYGWQELILNRPAACAHCGAALAGGVSAYRGLQEQPGRPVFLCATCVRRLRQPPADKQEDTR